jgi:hypothetical protein
MDQNSDLDVDQNSVLNDDLDQNSDQIVDPNSDKNNDENSDQNNDENSDQDIGQNSDDSELLNDSKNMSNEVSHILVEESIEEIRNRTNMYNHNISINNVVDELTEIILAGETFGAIDEFWDNRGEQYLHDSDLEGSPGQYDSEASQSQYEPEGSQSQYDPEGSHNQYDSEGSHNQYDQEGSRDRYELEGSHGQYEPEGSHGQYEQEKPTHKRMPSHAAINSEDLRREYEQEFDYQTLSDVDIEGSLQSDDFNSEMENQDFNVFENRHQPAVNHLKYNHSDSQ